MVGGTTTITNTTMLAKDQTRLRIEKMEAERQQRRVNAACAKVRRAKQIEQNLSQGNPGDVDFIGLVRQWREEHAGLATAHDKQAGDYDDQLLLKEDKICVCVRKRPLNTKELAKKEHDVVTCLHPTATVHSAKLRVDGISKYCDHNTFRFDHAFDEEACTEDVYRFTAQPLVSYVCETNVCEGKKGFIPRATVFAYGQTGSGEFFYMCMCVCLLFPFILYFSQLNIIFTFVVARQDTYNGWNSNNGCRGYLLDTEQQQ